MHPENPIARHSPPAGKPGRSEGRPEGTPRTPEDSRGQPSRPSGGARKPADSRPPDPRRALGQLGEQIASAHLQRLGFAILDRNVRIRGGELDLVAFNGKTIVFVEVKTRRRPGHVANAGLPWWAPLQSLRHRQRLRLRALAGAWLHQSRVHAREVRFDAIGVLVDRQDRPLSIDHVEGAW